MRRVRYAVAASLDGYIAGPNGEADWIIMDPDIDFRALFEQFDTVLLGRRTFEAMARGGKAGIPGMKTFVFSRTLRQRDYGCDHRWGKLRVFYEVVPGEPGLVRILAVGKKDRSILRIAGQEITS